MSRKITVAGRALLVAAVALATGLVSAPPAQAAYLGYAMIKGNTMQKGDWLSRTIPGSYTVQLIMQPDGNLVLKRTNGHVCWAAGSNPSGSYATYQGDGNFVIYNSANPRRAVWASNTAGRDGDSVSIERDGDLWVGNTEIATC